MIEDETKNKAPISKSMLQFKRSQAVTNSKHFGCRISLFQPVRNICAAINMQCLFTSRIRSQPEWVRLADTRTDFGSSHGEIPVPCCTKDETTSLNKSRCYMEVTSFSLINIVYSRSKCKDPAHQAELLVPCSYCKSGCQYQRQSKTSTASCLLLASVFSGVVMTPEPLRAGEWKWQTSEVVLGSLIHTLDFFDAVMQLLGCLCILFSNVRFTVLAGSHVSGEVLPVLLSVIYWGLLIVVQYCARCAGVAEAHILDERKFRSVCHHRMKALVELRLSYFTPYVCCSQSSGY